MTMFITTAAKAKALFAPEHFETFCRENQISPTSAHLHLKYVAIDRLDLQRFGQGELAEQIRTEVDHLTGRA